MTLSGLEGIEGLTEEQKKIFWSKDFFGQLINIWKQGEYVGSVYEGECEKADFEIEVICILLDPAKTGYYLQKDILRIANQAAKVKKIFMRPHMLMALDYAFSKDKEPGSSRYKI